MNSNGPTSFRYLTGQSAMTNRQRYLLGGLTIAALALSASCASRLEKDKVDRVERGGEGQVIDISQLHFTELESGSSIDLKTFMERDGKEFVLLVFGSMSCSSCNRKNEFLRDDVLGKHELYTNERGRAFELVGVNTDVERLRSSVQLFRNERRFDFIRLADPRGETMIKQLLPAGEAYGVPFTVLMTKRGIAWRYTNKDHVDIAEIMNRVAINMGLNSGGNPPPAVPTPVPTQLPLPAVLGRLQLSVPDRLAGVSLASCSGAERGNLNSEFGDPDIRYTVVARGACDGACQATLTDLREVCGGSGALNGRTCQVQGLAGEAAGDDCESFGVAKGGKEFFEVFPTFFDWAHPRQLAANQSDVLIPPMDDLIVMGFDRGGEIVYAREGAVTAAQVTARMQEPSFGTRERGPDFLFYGGAGEQRFADMRSSAQFTVLNFFDVNCIDCVKEMGEWSKPGNLYDFCAASGGKCQTIAFEDQEDYMDRPIFDYYQEVLGPETTAGSKGIRSYGVRLPLILDPFKSDPDDPKSRLPRVYDGYFKGLYGKTSFVGGAMVWDREGKVVDFVGAPFSDIDAVQKRLEKLINLYGLQ